ncbi:E3 ubiquitin-protein ligase TRIM56-like [Gigantopelta aegis]|uniref:E3 ubiquitin-protein ligase TRIM56-like n=1 Tax=Gigantopelta aegis TaxID=1735272 RepID=UPI001B887706|nr:E3 ubiquitin-protein ligase TRIM56-like [Gigantopelta aegis]
MAAADVRTCSICIEQFKEPKLLPCFHTFCLHCLQHYVATSVQDGTFNCPVCRYEVTVPEGGVSAFQTNFYIEAEADRQAYTPSQKCDICSNPADRKCLECSQFFCKSCTAFHSSLGATRSHTTITLGEVEEDSAVISRPQFCIKHKGEVMRFYCRPCEKPICRDCKLTSHEGHKTVDLCDLVADAKSSLAKAKVGFEECINTLGGDLRLIDVNRASLESTRVKKCADIKRLADALIDLIKKHSTEEIEKIIDIEQSAGKCLEERRSQVARSKRYLQAQIDHVIMIISTGLDADVITTANEVKKVLQNVKGKKEASLASILTLENPFNQELLITKQMKILANTNVFLASHIIASKAVELKIRSTFTFVPEPVDVIGPLSNINSVCIGYTAKGCQNNCLILVNVKGQITKKFFVQHDRYRHIRMQGIQFLLPEWNTESHENSVEPSNDEAHKTCVFLGKQIPLVDKNANGDICKIDTNNKSVEIDLADGSVIPCNMDDIPEYKIGFSPRDVCWGLKNDIFIADFGLNVVHR